jgi:hypothetical protein
MNTNENTPPTPKRKRYAEAFQRATVEHWMLSGKSARQRFERIKAMQSEYFTEQLRATLSVTRSGYHAWSGRRPGPRAQANVGVVAAHRTSASGKPSDLRGNATYDLVVALAEFTDHRLPPRREFFFGTQPRLLMQPDHHALVGHDGHALRRTQFFRAFGQ